MEIGPNIPQIDHEVFKNPPLKVMLGQVRFPPVLRIADLPSLVPFQDAIRKEFPNFAQEPQITFTFGPLAPPQSIAQQAFRFSTADRAWSILLAPDALTLEADVSVAYTSYEEFSQRFRLAWEATVTHFGPTELLRQGLRYVDHIEGDRPAPEWASVINEDLLGPLVGAFGAGVAQSVSELRFPRDDGVLVFKHGLIPLGGQNTPGYLLDFDYFNEEASEDVSVDGVMGRFDDYHDLLYRFFRWCVTDEALDGFRNAS